MSKLPVVPDRNYESVLLEVEEGLKGHTGKNAFTGSFFRSEWETMRDALRVAHELQQRQKA